MTEYGEKVHISEGVFFFFKLLTIEVALIIIFLKNAFISFKNDPFEFWGSAKFSLELYQL